MASHKQDRTAQDIKRIVNAKMRELKDPRIGDAMMLTIVRCEIARDGSFCRIYVSSLNGIEHAKSAVQGLTSATGYLKREISNVLGLRKSPELKFIADDSVEYSAKISKILKEVLPEENKENDENDDD